MPVIEVKSEEEFKKQLAAAGSKKIIIDFHATWCGPCKMISPVLEECSNKYSTIVFLKVDVDEVEDLAGKYGINAMPTFVVVNSNGDKIDDLVGASKPNLEAMVEKHK
eukprot:TRINITY_DN48322_c0_g1_i1.p1 TRINITY_DN48322_c0_g1~~TRINITY_DN48322_c0_g1_i1.p1  ORF type:complete len:108 (+),score=18.29 TRINITY_DN48322_c0_g1_i1:48-371(+)